MYAIITLPTWESIATGTQTYATGAFSEFLSIALMLVGIGVGTMLLVLVARAVFKGVGKLKGLVGGGRRRRGRR